MSVRELLMGAAVGLFIGLLLGLMVRGGQITRLELTATGLRATVERQEVGLEGLGRMIQSQNQVVDP